MANDTSKNAGADGHRTDEELERQKTAAFKTLLAQSLRFVEGDLQANELVLRLAKVAVEMAEKHPDAVFSGSRGNIDEIVSALKGGVKGGDIVGGDTIDDIIRIINALINLITGGEKDFFLAIIRLIFCGC